jgi:hypothetical protein
MIAALPILALASIAAAAASDGASGLPAALSKYYGSKPNVIVLFCDDFGFGDVGHNNPDVKETVAIDALAAGGMTFKNMHTFPLCTPSRAQLLTGRLGARTGVTTNFAPSSLHGLPRTEQTIAELLRPAGACVPLRARASPTAWPAHLLQLSTFNHCTHPPQAMTLQCWANGALA